MRPAVALAFSTIGFVALTIFGLGMVSLATGEDVIATSGLGQVPGIVGMILSVLAFAGGLWASIGRRGRTPSFGGVAWTTAACFLAYIGGVWFGVLTTGAGLAVAAGVAGRLATSWFGAVVAGAAFVSAWAGIALVRTRAHRPRWPWEDPRDA
ncbi:hypothetical protein [Microbacterium sp. NPDC058389]|uniref:hypothetical protein n=1 Tax=Microbacterium sp. NPDC058389 TaxID=3346475 RepID=UPI0036547BF6